MSSVSCLKYQDAKLYAQLKVTLRSHFKLGNQPDLIYSMRSSRCLPLVLRKSHNAFIHKNIVIYSETKILEAYANSVFLEEL